MVRIRRFAILATGIALGLSVPAFADVKAGVEAWARGDYDRAVAEWRELAAAGDADAQFNMAQAYRLGRGVKANARQAEILYAKAAAQGHIKAADNYGLLLFQAGRREEAIPYVTAAADRGDPRAQYLLGIAHFNGDMVEKDWVRAYALVTLANSAGLPQAPAAIKQMDGFIPMEQRQQAQALAQKLKSDSDARRAQQLAAADLATTGRKPTAKPAPSRVASAPLPSPATRLPQPVRSVPAQPSVAAAQAAVAEAARVTGTESPAEAGADFRRPAIASAEPVRTARAEPPARSTAKPPRSAPKPARTSSARAASKNGPWRVQLGAFSVRGNADKLWSRLSRNSALSGTKKVMVPAGRIVRLQAGGFATRSSAQSACNALKRSGQDCLVTR